MEPVKIRKTKSYVAEQQTNHRYNIITYILMSLESQVSHIAKQSNHITDDIKSELIELSFERFISDDWYNKVISFPLEKYNVDFLNYINRTIFECVKIELVKYFYETEHRLYTLQDLFLSNLYSSVEYQFRNVEDFSNNIKVNFYLIEYMDKYPNCYKD